MDRVEEIEGYRYVLNAESVEPCYKMYDLGLGYAGVLQVARKLMKRSFNPESAIAKEGVVLPQALSAERAAELSELCSAQDECLGDPDFVETVLYQVFNPEVDQLIRDYFQCEYHPLWYRFESCDTSFEQKSVSFKWHCDSGPSLSLKLLVYLNDYSEHGGSTRYIDWESSNAMHELGYTFGDIKDRQPEIQPLSRAHDLPYHEVRPELKAGQAVLFPPTRLLHKGAAPRPGTRRNVFHVCIIPYPQPWQISVHEFRPPANGDDRWVSFRPA